jgi:hypothetical protein
MQLHCQICSKFIPAYELVETAILAKTPNHDVPSNPPNSVARTHPEANADTSESRHHRPSLP